MSEPRAYLVESIPVGLEDLRGTPGVQYTEDVLVRLTSGRPIHHRPHGHVLGAAARSRRATMRRASTKSAVRRRWAPAPAAKLYQALRDAAARGVTIRILQSPGFSKSGQKGNPTSCARVPGPRIDSLR